MQYNSNSRDEVLSLQRDNSISVELSSRQQMKLVNSHTGLLIALN